MRAKTMFYADYTDPNGVRRANIYYDWSEYYKDTFSPKCRPGDLVVFAVTGTNYAERQASVRQVAAEAQGITEDLSYSEWAAIHDWFKLQGKRYGLLNEFNENGIC